jgi:hypothetical protein
MADVAIPGEFGSNPRPPALSYNDSVPENLRAATSRLQFPPSYAIVGVYRLCTDKKLLEPAWKKCKHGVIRGAGVALVWVSRVNELLEAADIELVV